MQKKKVFFIADHILLIFFSSETYDWFWSNVNDLQNLLD